MLEQGVEGDAVLKVFVALLERAEAQFFREYLVRKLLQLSFVYALVGLVVRSVGLAFRLHDQEPPATCLNEEVGEIPRHALLLGAPVLKVKIVMRRVSGSARKIYFFYRLARVEYPSEIAEQLFLVGAVKVIGVDVEAEASLVAALLLDFAVHHERVFVLLDAYFERIELGELPLMTMTKS